jgi:hypothetical protein
MNKPIKENILKIYGRDPATLDELARCVIAVIESQMNRDSFASRNGRGTRPYRVLGFAWDIGHGEMISNSHSSPEGLPQNWGAKDHLPKGYPGWSGRVWIRYDEEPRSWGSTPFERTLTHTGTGGAGGYSGPWEGISSARFRRYGHSNKKGAYPEINCYSWDYRFYEADWPALAKWVDQQKVWSILSGKPWQNRHRFNWTDPETLERDTAFIRDSAIIKAKEFA